MGEPVGTLRWVGDTDGHLVLVDQTELPVKFVEHECRNVADVLEAIQNMRIRGAPAIGIAAAYGVCLGIQPAVVGGKAILLERLEEVTARLVETRPTAVNLSWAIGRMKRASQTMRGDSPNEIAAGLLAEARAIHEEDRRMCRAIGLHGKELLFDGQSLLTHCNAGGLATSEYGTALAVLFAAQEAGKRIQTYVSETRPLLQGSRLTAWELLQRGMDVTVICDSMAAHVMRERRVQGVITGADRIAANGDTANKIGTYGLALAAAAHEIPFYVAAPTSSFDLSMQSGEAIPIECRSADEVVRAFGVQTAPDGVNVYNPAFDVTPARLIKAIVCERGIIAPVTAKRIADMVG